jgi:anthraniloyl-CoA monooxygenase
LKTVVVGGGPGGLLYAALAKRRCPQHEVVVLERNPRGATFGFGVVFSESTLTGFAEADPDLQAAIAQAGVDWQDIIVQRDGETLACGGHGFSAVARVTLLDLLHERAVAAGAEVRYEHEATEADLEGADLVLAADGVNSLIRRSREAAFGPEFDVGAARYIWFGTKQPFHGLTFVFVANEHGRWGLHAYPYEDGTSTFLVETDEATWRRAGLDQTGDLPPGVSDEASKAYIERLFADQLGGHELLGNNSKWLEFRTLRCASWSAGNVALVGDAAHTAHFSVGSGTKMAMEDALALSDAVAAADDVPGALASYEQVRRPAVERIQAAAAPSLVWWERFRFLEERTPEEFAFHFLSRSPMVTRDRLAARDWRFVRRVEARHAAETGADRSGGPLTAPLELGPLRLPSRLVVEAAVGIDPLVALGGPAVAGAGLVVAAPDTDADAAVAWVHEHTDAAVARRLPPEAGEAEVAAAERAGFDVLIVPAGAAPAWPADRVLCLAVAAPADSESAEGDRLVAALRDAAADRPVLVAVGPPAGAGASRDALAIQLMLCDRLREEAGLPCMLDGAVRNADEAVTAVLAGRADLVEGAPSLVSRDWRAGPATRGLVTSEQER